MLDGVILGLEATGVLVNIGGRSMRVRELDEVHVIESPHGGSSITIGQNKGKLIIKGNPINWLTAQNVFGTNNVYGLCTAFLSDLKAQKIIRFKKETWDQIVEGAYDIHQLAFNKYLKLEAAYKFPVMDLLKHTFGGIASNVKLLNDMRWMLYQGTGVIVNNRSVNLTIYDKLELIKQKHPDWSNPLVPSLDRLEDLMRVEVTVKYSWFSACKRRMSWWRNRDCDAEAHRILTKTLCFFGFDYIMACPNVFADDYGKDWSKRDRELLAMWHKGHTMTRPDAGRLWRRYRFNATISVTGHKNILWTLSKPANVALPTLVDIRRAKSFSGKELLSVIHPITDFLVVGASKQQLRLINKACGLDRDGN